MGLKAEIRPKGHKNSIKTHTISHQNVSAMVPGCEDFVFQHNLGDILLVGQVIKVAHCAFLPIVELEREIPSLITHGCSGVIAPLRIVVVSKPLFHGCFARFCV